MAVAFDNEFAQNFAGAGTGNHSFTSSAGNIASGGGTGIGSGANRVLIIEVKFSLAIASLGTVTASWGGTGATFIASVDTPAGAMSAWLFGLIAPASGNATLLVNNSAGTGVDITLGGASFTGADQVTGWNNAGSDTGTGTSASSTVTTNNGDAGVVCHVDNNATSLAIGSGAQEWIDTNLNGNAGAGHVLSSGSTGVVSFNLGSSVAWANAKVNVLQVGGGAVRVPYQPNYFNSPAQGY
jgi:hypothetical protein